MRNLLFVLFVSAFLFSCGNKNNETTVTDLDINTFNDEAANYVDQDVSITGICVHVCKHSGKKMHLIGDANEKKIIVFAGEGVSEFPMEFEGLMVKVTGKVIEEVITEETILEWEAADAKEKEEADLAAASEPASDEGAVEVIADKAEKIVDAKVKEVVPVEADIADVEATEGDVVEEESHACKDEGGTKYGDFRKKIAESPDGKLRSYYIEVTSFEEVKPEAK